MGYWDYFRFGIMNFFGLKPKLSKPLMDIIKERQTEKQGHIPEPTPGNKKCDYKSCRKFLKGLTYRCKYCHGTYCEKHRLPEDHDCEHPGLPRLMKLGSGSRDLSTNRFDEAMGERNLG